MAKILVVDDEPGIRRELALLLEDDGLIVSQAENGLKAKEKYSNENFDLIITDILMPDMDGIELIQDITKNFPSMPIIAISGGGKYYASDNNANEISFLKMAKKMGALHILKKPFDYEQLLELVQDCL